MRIFIRIRSDNKPVPFNYQPILTGAIHKWIGVNEIHDKTSMYSFSWLDGGSKNGDHLIFEKETNFDFSSYDKNLLKKVIAGIQLDPTINYGLEVSEVVITKTPLFRDKEIFHVSSPVLVKRREQDKEIHFTYDQVETDHLLTETLKTKLRRAGLDDNNVHVAFDRGYPGAKTKIVYYKNIGNKTSICPVIIEGSKEQIAFAWNVGVGNSTGIGFGALK
jgi:CRISPR-associated endoribonuclease Cas6